MDESSRARLRSLLLFVVPGVLLGLLLVAVDVDLPRSLPALLLHLAAGFLVSVAFHELGHAVAGALVGFRLLAFAVWPLHLYRAGGRWRISWLSMRHVAGFVTPDPVHTNGLPGRLFWMIAGGPIASLILAIIAYLAYLDGSAWPDWVRSACVLTAIWSCLFAISGFLPVRTQYAISDGLRMQMLLRGGPEAERFCCLSLLNSAVVGAARPREWSAELVHMASSLDDGAPDAIAALCLRYNWLLDLGQLEEAGAVLDRVADADQPSERKAIWQLEAAWFEARFRNRPDRARELLMAAPSAPDTYDVAQQRAKAEAGVAYAERRWADAETAARKALRICEHLPKTGTNQALAEELNALLHDVASVNRS